MEKREHDLFLDMKSNPNATFDDLVVAGLTAENTALQDRSAYENDDWVREQFKDQYGNFDKVGFDTFYNNAKVYYNSLADADYEKSVNKVVNFHRDNIFVPIEQRRKGPDFAEIQISNPYHITSSITLLGRLGEKTRSDDENAQTQKVLLNPTTAGENLENAQWGNSPNEDFFGYFDDTLVLAQYDEKGTHIDPFSGKEVAHEAGQLKLNNDGEFYYEKLDGRDIYGRRVLNKMNVLTVDGSKWNDYDFFDSDDVNQKSTGTTILKNLALVGSMFIPCVRPWIIGLNIANQTIGLLGTLGKIMTGSNSPTFSAMEGWSKSMSRQGVSSEYAKEHPWCLENMINLAGDVAGQIAELRFIFTKVPELFKGKMPITDKALAAKLAEFKNDRLKLVNVKMEELRKSNVDDLVKIELNLKVQASLDAVKDLQAWTKEYQTIGEVLGKGYMTAITVQDTYGEAKLAGASDMDAAILTLGYAAGEYALLSTGLGQWFMPELKANERRYKAILKALPKLGDESKLTAMLTAQNVAVKEGKKNYIKRLFDTGRKIASDVYTANKSLSKNLAVSTFYNGLSEGTEEVSEELLADFSKGCFDAVKWLQGEDTRIDAFGYNFKKKEFNLEDALDRYSLSLVGGFFGGAFANVASDFRTLNKENKITSLQALQELIYMCRNGEINDFMKTMAKTLIGDVNKSTKSEIINGKLVFAPGTEDDNQDLAAKLIILNQVNMLQNIIQANGGVSDSEFLSRLTLGDLRFNALANSTTAGLYLLTYNNLLADVYTLTAAINDASSVDSNNNGVEEDSEKTNNQPDDALKLNISNLKKELKEKQLKLLDLLDGKYALDFISTALIEINGTMSKMGGIPSVFSLFAESKYKKKFLDLTDQEKKDAVEEYKTLKTTEYRDLLLVFSQMYRQMASLMSPVLTNQATTYQNTSTELLRLNKVISDLYKVINIGGEQKWLEILALSMPAEKYLPLALTVASTDKAGRSITNANLILRQILVSNDPDEVGNLISQLDKIPLFNIGQHIAELSDDKEFAKYVNDTKKQIYDLLIENDKLLKAADENPEDENNFLLIKLNNEAIENLFLSFNDNTSTLILNNISSIANEFINQGFISTEAKNLILGLISFAQNLANMKAAEFEEMHSEFEPNEYLPKLNEIKSLNEQVKNLSSTPLELNLNEVAILLGEQPIKLTELIEQANIAFNSMADDVSTFDVPANIAEGIKEALNLMNLYKLAILGARTDANNTKNLYGYNATLNEIAGKISEKLDLAEIDSATADNFLADIDANISKLTYLLNLYNINNSLKMTKNDRIGIKKDLLVYKRLQYTFDSPDKEDPLSSWNGINELRQAIKGMTLHGQLLSSNATKVDDREAFEKEKAASENAIYDFFQANLDKLSDPTKLAELINPSRLDLYSPAKEILDENLDNLDDNSFIWWLASRAALKAEDFYHMYGTIIDPNTEKPMAPLPTQELSIYNNIASVINPKIYKYFYNTYRQSIKEDWKNRTLEERIEILKRLGKSEKTIDILKDVQLDDYVFNIIPVPRYTNIVLTEGAPGTGKTSYVLGTTLAMLKKFYPDKYKKIAIVHGADIKSANKLKEAFNELDADTYGRVEFMKFINSQWREYVKNDRDNTYSVPVSDADYNEEKELRSKLGINDNSNPPDLVIIDEVSKFSAYDLDLVDKFAQKYGITVLVAGDFDQSGFVGSHKVDLGSYNGITYQISLDKTNFIRCPKLGISMRTDNDLKTMNLAKTRYYMQNPRGKLLLSYALDKNGIYGDKVISYDAIVQRNEDDEIYGINTDLSTVLPAVIEDVNALIDLIQHKDDTPLEEDEKIGYIYNDINSPIYKELSLDKYKPYISLKLGGTAQGLEGKFYIVEPSITDDKLTSLKDIYTGMSRASLGSILILPNGMDKAILPISSEKKVAVQKEPLPDDVIRKYADTRKKLYAGIYPNGKVPNIQRIAVTRPATRPATTLEDGIDPEPEYNYDEDKINAIQAINRATNIDDIDRFIFELESRSNVKDDLEVLNAANARKAELRRFENNNKTEWEERHEALVNKYVGATNEFVNNGVFASGVRAIGEVDDLDPGIAVDNQWFLPGDIITLSDGTTITPEWLDNGGVMGTGFNVLLSPQLIERFFTGEKPPEGTIYITHNSRLGEAKSLTEEAPIEAPMPEYYQGDGSPVTSVDLVETSDLELTLDDENSSESLPKPTGETVLLHTFNTFELGTLFQNDHLETVEGWGDYRIDSINGLRRIDRIFGKTHSDTDYIKMIGRLRTAIFTIPDKAELEEEIENILGISGIYSTFALKTTSRVGNDGRKEGRSYSSTNPNPFEKSWREKTLYNVSDDVRSDEVNNKLIVLIIGTDENGNLLELPLIKPGSPFTLLSSTYGQNMWPKMYEDYLAMLKGGMDMYHIALKLIKDYEGRSGTQSIIKHFKLFTSDSNLIKYIEDPNWTIANGFLNLGAQFITDAGYYQKAAGFDFNDEINPESKWITVDDFSKGIVQGRPETYLLDENPLFRMTPILVSTINEYGNGEGDDIELPIKKGHSFIIVSSDPINYSNPEDIVNRYLEELRNPSLPKLTYRIYVRPPKASIEEYIVNLHNANFTKRGERDSIVKSIGYFTTSAKMLLILVLDNGFMDLVRRKYPNVVPLLMNAIDKVNEARTMTQLKNVLYSKENWIAAGVSYKDTSLCYLFDELLARLGWRDLNSSITGAEPIHEKDSEAIQLITNVLSKVGEKYETVFYHTPISQKAELLRKIGPFVIGELIENYSIDGKPYYIHGKLDSFTFEGDIDWLIDSFFNALTNGNGTYTQDNISYAPHRLIGNSSLHKTTVNPLDRKYRDLETYIQNRTGTKITLSRIDHGLERAVELINNSESNQVAFVINDDIVISDKNPNISGKIYLYDDSDNPIRNISNLSDNSGIYSFKISAIIDGKLQKLNASYDSRSKVMEIERVPNIPTELQISITPETFNDWITKAREVLIDIAGQDIDVEDLLAIDDYNTFMQVIDNWLGTSTMKDKYIELLNSTSDELSKLIIEDMINIEEFGMKDDINECLPKLKINF